jgi:hypothetical protein
MQATAGMPTAGTLATEVMPATLETLTADILQQQLGQQQ